MKMLQLLTLLAGLTTSEPDAHLTAIPKEIQGLQWNRWTSKNFVVLSLDDKQGQYLHKNLELVKTWTLSRWGFYDVDFSAECKIICVTDPALFLKMFHLKQTKVEIHRTNEGKIKSSVIFLLLDDLPSKTVPGPLTEICLSEFSQKYNINFDWWVYRGVVLLNGSVGQIKSQIIGMKQHLERDDPIFFSKSLLEMSKERYLQSPEETRLLFDKSALLFCLLLRKEFGQDQFHAFLKKSKEPELAIKSVLGFKDYADLDRTFKRYMVDITRDIRNSRTPDHYLQIIEKK